MEWGRPGRKGTDLQEHGQRVPVASLAPQPLQPLEPGRRQQWLRGRTVQRCGKDNVLIPVHNSAEELGKTGGVIDLASKGRFLYIIFLLLWKYFLPIGLSRWGVFL